MEIIVKPDSHCASRLAARFVAALISKRPKAVIGLASGSTPLQLYLELIHLHRAEGLDFSQVTTFNLDEYCGLSPDHPSSYHHFMWTHFFEHINISRERVNIPDGLTKDVPRFCQRYEELIEQSGGIDLQILGIGINGHIGFNEPSSSLNSKTRLKTLSPQTIEANAGSFRGAENIPRHVITMGIGTILNARHCLLLAFGEEKAPAITGMVEGPLTAFLPASALQHHPRVSVFLDEAAAAQLQHLQYYKWVYHNKPAWQRFE